MTILSWEEIEDRAVNFRNTWEKQRGAERQQAQNFIRDFLSVFGIENPMDNNGEFEHKCPKEVGDDGYIDYFLPKKLIVEMKSKDWERGTRKDIVLVMNSLEEISRMLSCMIAKLDE